MREKKKYKIQKLTTSVNSKNDDRSIQILICVTKGEEMVCRNCIDQDLNLALLTQLRSESPKDCIKMTLRQKKPNIFRNCLKRYASLFLWKICQKVANIL